MLLYNSVTVLSVHGEDDLLYNGTRATQHTRNVNHLAPVSNVQRFDVRARDNQECTSNRHTLAGHMHGLEVMVRSANGVKMNL